ncbi:MAG: pentapeptide repeat-containing protein [Bacteroidales bacterium]
MGRQNLNNTFSFDKRTNQLFTIGLIILSVSFVIFYNYIVCFIFPPGTRVANNAHIDTLKFLSVIIGGYLLIWQIVLTNRRTKAAEKTADAAMENIRIIENGQIQERFKNAIDQLGHEKTAVILGAIYTLHHIAKVSLELRKSIFDILCTYIRDITSEEGYKTNKFPDIKVQSILNLLFINLNERETYIQYNADLHDANLDGALFVNASMVGANLRNASLLNANLSEADLSFSDLYNADLSEANLTKAIFIEAKLIETALMMSNLQGADLSGADLNLSNISNADLNGACLRDTNLRDADLSFTDLSDVYVGSSNWIDEIWFCSGVDIIRDKYFVAQEIEEGEPVFIIKERLKNP